jgi:2'-5' RNA ligase
VVGRGSRPRQKPVKRAMAMSKLCLVYTVEPLGEEVFSRWPLHITLVPWFEYPEPESILANHLDDFLKKVRITEGVVGKKTWFGYDLPVRLVEPKDKIAKLHNDLLGAVSAAGGQLSAKTYTGPRYTPHITVRGQRSIEPGLVIKIDRITLVKSVSDQPQLRQKTAEFRLGL